MWNNFVYRFFDKPLYVLFYWRWNPRFAENRKIRQDFLDSFRIWEGKTSEEPSKLAMDYAIIWSRTSSPHTTENLAKLFEEVMWEVRNADPRCN